jgi:hypothetical protein
MISVPGQYSKMAGLKLGLNHMKWESYSVILNYEYNDKEPPDRGAGVAQLV